MKERKLLSVAVTNLYEAEAILSFVQSLPLGRPIAKTSELFMCFGRVAFKGSGRGGFFFSRVLSKSNLRYLFFSKLPSFKLSP